jgi:hypothetical protein
MVFRGTLASCIPPDSRALDARLWCCHQLNATTAEAGGGMAIGTRLRQVAAGLAIIGSLAAGGALVAIGMDGTSTTPLRSVGASATPLVGAALRPPVAGIDLMRPPGRQVPAVTTHSDKASPLL